MLEWICGIITVTIISAKYIYTEGNCTLIASIKNASLIQLYLYNEGRGKSNIKMNPKYSFSDKEVAEWNTISKTSQSPLGI